MHPWYPLTYLKCVVSVKVSLIFFLLSTSGAVISFYLFPSQLYLANIEQSKAKYFTMFDALKGYHQCTLDEENEKLTTFIMPFGRFKFLQGPYGICSISEHYSRRVDEAFTGMQDFHRVVDDFVIFDMDQQQHVRQLLHRCEEIRISLNRDMFKFCQIEVQFAGFKLTST